MHEITEEEVNKFHNKISKNIKEIRKKQNKTQLDLSLELGFKNSSFISHVENKDKKEYKYSLTHLYILSKYLNTEIENFLK